MSRLKPPVNEEDHIYGVINSPLILVEYGDFQCSYCKAAYPVLKKLEHQFNGKMAFVFRHFPLSNIHPMSNIAAISSEAASKQGKFWEMHDQLFANQSKLSVDYLDRIAEALHLDIKTFRKDMKDTEIIKKINRQFESGILSGINGTPSFYINGVKYNGSYDFDSLLETLSETAAHYELLR